jgi:hypothetical protein
VFCRSVAIIETIRPATIAGAAGLVAGATACSPFRPSDTLVIDYRIGVEGFVPAMIIAAGMLVGSITRRWSAIYVLAAVLVFLPVIILASVTLSAGQRVNAPRRPV